MLNIADDELELLLDKVYRTRGWDFRNYKKASLKRRITKRLQQCRVSSFMDYSGLLDSDPAEFDRLFSTITIKVSEFFREPEVFSVLREAVKSVYADKMALRAWCCGCAYGEEAYTLAILLAETLSHRAFKLSKVFATDIDEEALDQARKAVYRNEFLKNVNPDIRHKFFLAQEGGLLKVKYAIRNIVMFGTLDIVKDPTISRIHILFCRNLFIYFNKTLQDKVFEKLDYALTPGGLLVLGKAEILPSRFSSRYTPIGERMNVYRKRL